METPQFCTKPLTLTYQYCIGHTCLLLWWCHMSSLAKNQQRKHQSFASLDFVGNLWAGLVLDILKTESWTHMGCTANIIIEDIIHFFIPPASTKLKGGYTGITLSVCPSVRLSVRLSVCGQNRVRSVSSTILMGSISYLHILSSNFRRCVACNARCKIQKFEILVNFLNL